MAHIWGLRRPGLPSPLPGGLPACRIGPRIPDNRRRPSARDAAPRHFWQKI